LLLDCTSFEAFIDILLENLKITAISNLRGIQIRDEYMCLGRSQEVPSKILTLTVIPKSKLRDHIDFFAFVSTARLGISKLDLIISHPTSYPPKHMQILIATKPGVWLCKHVGMTSAKPGRFTSPQPQIPVSIDSTHKNTSPPAKYSSFNKLDTLIDMTSVVASNLGKDGMFHVAKREADA